MITSESSEETHSSSDNLSSTNDSNGEATFSTTDNNIKTMRQEFIAYILFLVVICTLSFGMVSQDMYYLNNAMAKLFLETTVSETENTNFKSISTISDFWKFAEGPLVDGLYWNSWNNISSGGKSFVYHENLLLGVPQIRQIKVLPNRCNIHSYFINTIKECFTPYHFKYEDTAEFGFKNSSEWRYYLPQYLEWHWGQMGTYSSGGYISTLAQTKDKSKLKIQYLKRNNWLTRGTRVVFIDFSFYNANVNLFCVARLIVEFPATGGAIPSSKFYAVKLLRYVSDTDYFLAFCEILFLLVVSVLIFQDVMRFKEQKLQYFKNVWNWINLLIIVASLLTVGFNVYRTVQVSLSLKNLLEDPNSYPNLHFLAYWQIQYNNVIALNVFFSWIKIFKYISFTTTMGLLSSALFRCAKDIMGFAVMFFIIFFSYAQLSFLIFGDEVTDFSTFANCIFTQFRIILGDFNFADIEKADKILGALYYVTFVFLAFFILMNIFLAIINDTYSEVKSDFSVRNTEINILSIIHQNYQTILNNIRQKKTQKKDSNVDSESEENGTNG